MESIMISRQNRYRILIALIPLAFLVGWFLHTPSTRHGAGEGAAITLPSAEYTCSMHPAVRSADPDAPCPLCGMDLIPVTSDGGDADEEGAVITLSPRARQLARVATSPVERRYVESGVQLLGKVTVDETRVRRISAWSAGRLDRLYVDYTGIRVAAGDHLAELFSPELITAQEELLQAKSGKRSGLGAEMLGAAREKLRLLGLTAIQIQEIEERGRPLDHVTISAPTGGIVIEKHAVEGAYVKVGSPIVSIVDLNQVWVKLDAYESDLPWLRYGQEVSFESIAHPGEIFTGQVAFVDPVLDERSRTVKVRVNVANDDGGLKPGMFVRATLRARLTADGRVADAGLAGKWISPMHPEVVKEGPGACDVCGMDLVPTESLGYAGAELSGEGAPLVIPATAPLITGRRAVVYVADPDAEGRYEGREVVLGPRAGDHYLVESGLMEGEQVVTRGNFKIDSALQILARPSMMNPASGGPASGHDSGAMAMAPQEDAVPAAADPLAAIGEGDRLSLPATFLEQIESLYSSYFDLQNALSHDKEHRARKQAKKLGEALDKVEMSLLSAEGHEVWMRLLPALRESAKAVESAGDIAASRREFEGLSAAVAALGKRFGREAGKELLVYHCPMAFDFQGADWLQESEGTENPYFGSSMFKCGTLQGNLNEESARD
jgi:membrane fusion protein, copper/silver efflux system